MRVPQSIRATDIVYRAMWGACLAVYHHNQRHPDKRIKSVCCPGLGTLTGRVDPDEAAAQMATAYRHFLEEAQHLSQQAPFDAAKERARIQKRLEEMHAVCEHVKDDADKANIVKQPLVMTPRARGKG